MLKILQVKEMATKLGVKENTIRRWSDQLEQAGYTLNRIGARRTYSEQDLKYFRRLRKWAEKLSLEDAAKETVASWEKDLKKAVELTEGSAVIGEQPSSNESSEEERAAPAALSLVKSEEMSITTEAEPRGEEEAIEHPPPMPSSISNVSDVKASEREISEAPAPAPTYTDTELRQLRRFNQMMTELPKSLYWNPQMVPTLLHEWEQVKRVLQPHTNGAFQHADPSDSDILHLLSSEVYSNDV